MTPNQIIMLVIVVLGSLILVVGTYVLVVFLLNKNREKKIDTIFNPTNLVEEQSLMNVMDQKKNVEFKGDDERFLTNAQEVKVVAQSALTQEQKINPFGVDLTMQDKTNGIKVEIEDNTSNSQNKFIK